MSFIEAKRYEIVAQSSSDYLGGFARTDIGPQGWFARNSAMQLLQRLLGRHQGPTHLLCVATASLKVRRRQKCQSELLPTPTFNTVRTRHPNTMK